MSSTLFTRVRATVGAAILAASLLGVTAAPGMAANTRITYFGSAACSGTSCPAAPASASAYAYPSGTGGGFSASGQPIAGQNSFTPVTAGSSTATDIVIQNVAPSTLTQVHVSGGSQAPNPINIDSVPATPGGIDPALCTPAGQCSASLPTGLYYQAVYTVANPSHVSVLCSLSGETGASTGQYRGLLCSIGNLAAKTTLTLRVVIATTTATPANAPLEPWFALQLKEGSSSTGGNSDVFLTYGLLSVDEPTCDATSNFFLDQQQISLSNAGLPCLQTTTVDTTKGFANGTLATVGSTPSSLCISGFTCFGWLSTSDILAGASVPGGVTWTITWSASLVPSGGPKEAIHFLDAYGPTNLKAYETITFKNKDQCGSTLVKMCWQALTKNADGSYTARIWTPTNGSIRG